MIVAGCAAKSMARDPFIFWTNVPSPLPGRPLLTRPLNRLDVVCTAAIPIGAKPRTTGCVPKGPTPFTCFQRTRVMLPRVQDVADRHAKMLSELAKLAVASTAATVVVWLLSLMT